MQQALDIAIVGGGPAGLKAAEIALERGHQVTLYEAKRSVGRKFLVAGKSGLNLTNDANIASFPQHYQGSDFPLPLWQSILNDFTNADTREWAASLGIPTFVSAGSKVFPEQMKAAPLLRKWITKLKDKGLTIKVNHKLCGLHADKNEVQLHFATPEAELCQTHDRTILALGGASWPKTGSDGTWTSMLENLGVKIIPLSAANCGWHCDWNPNLLTEAEGLPLKNAVFSSANKMLEGEVVLTRYGLEGGPIYKLGPQIRATGKLFIDLKPTFSETQLLAKMESAKKNLFAEAIKRWKLSPAASSILRHQCEAEKLNKEQLAKLVKQLSLTLTKPRPIAEAISSAGGICWSELNQNLSLKKAPSISVAGEMIDWEAPTGGFLLQGCLATAVRAASEMA